MALKTITFGKAALASLGAAALAFPLYGAIAQEEAAPEELTAEQVESSRALFQQFGCSSCHLFADAGGSGHIGPALDGNDGLSAEYISQIINNGQGAMPSFGGMVSEEEVDTLSRYIMSAKQ